LCPCCIAGARVPPRRAAVALGIGS
jgi:hypothetical protein